MATRDLTDDQLLQSLIDFCVKYSTPALADDDHVIDGFSNNRQPPDDGNDFCVVQPIAQRRSGTTIEHWDPTGEEVLELREYVELDVQIDCYSTNRFDARARAQTFETIARSSVGVEHFLSYGGIDCLYSDDSQNLSGVLDEGLYVSRWMLVIHLGYWKRVEVAQDFFDAVDVNVTNVDVRFKP